MRTCSFAFAFYLVFSSGCTEASARNAQVSVTPTPPSWDAEGFTKAFETARNCSSIISIQDPIDWWMLEGRSKTDSKAYKDSQWQSLLIGDLDVFIQIDPYPMRSGEVYPGKTFADADVVEAYYCDALQRIELYKAKYICLAMEVNSYYITHPEDFDNLMKCCGEIYDRIKASHPDVIVFVSYQYETLVNLNQWHLISSYADLFDAVGLTTYPHVFNKQISSDLPADYYSRIRTYTRKPIVFAEIGWTSNPQFGSSQIVQEKFVQSVFKTTKGMNVLLYNYHFLYDISGFGVEFDEMGLVDKSGNKKLAFDDVFGAMK